MTELATPEEHAAADPLAEAYRREKRAFGWTCGWIGAVTLVYGIAFAANLWYRHETVKLRSTGRSDEVSALVGQSLPLFSISSLLLVTFLIGFLICLVRWLLAIRRRRRFFQNSLKDG